MAALELVRDGHGGRAHGVGVPARREADVDVQSAVARRLRVRGDAELVEQRPEMVRRAPRLVEAGARLRVEVQAQLVAVLGVGGPVGPHVEAEAAEVDRPRDMGEVGDDEREEKPNDGRALLNLGHTFGHALEAEYGYTGGLLHGEGVGIGLGLAFKLSARLGYCAPAKFEQRLLAQGAQAQPGANGRHA